MASAMIGKRIHLWTHRLLSEYRRITDKEFASLMSSYDVRKTSRVVLELGSDCASIAFAALCRRYLTSQVFVVLLSRLSLVNQHNVTREVELAVLQLQNLGLDCTVVVPGNVRLTPTQDHVALQNFPSPAQSLIDTSAAVRRFSKEADFHLIPSPAETNLLDTLSFPNCLTDFFPPTKSFRGKTKIIRVRDFPMVRYQATCEALSLVYPKTSENYVPLFASRSQALQEMQSNSAMINHLAKLTHHAKIHLYTARTLLRDVIKGAFTKSGFPYLEFALTPQVASSRALLAMLLTQLTRCMFLHTIKLHHIDLWRSSTIRVDDMLNHLVRKPAVSFTTSQMHFRPLETSLCGAVARASPSSPHQFWKVARQNVEPRKLLKPGEAVIWNEYTVELHRDSTDVLFIDSMDTAPPDQIPSLFQGEYHQDILASIPVIFRLKPTWQFVSSPAIYNTECDVHVRQRPKFKNAFQEMFGFDPRNLNPLDEYIVQQSSRE